MKNNPPQHLMFILPESFDPHEMLPTELRRFSDDARHFVSTIMRKTSRGHVDRDGNVRLAAKYLRRIMNFREYAHVIEAMLDRGVINRASYQVGVKLFGYRLSERFVNDKHVRVAATDRRLIGRLEAFYAEQARERRSRMQPVHEALERHQQRLSIDRDHAAEVLMRLPPKSNPWDSQNVLIRDIEDKHFRLSIGTYGRVFNNISALKRELRQALRLGKDPLSNVDIRCCQPALLGRLAQEAAIQQAAATQQAAAGQQAAADAACNYDVQIGGDIGNFSRLVKNGGFYEFLMSNLQNRSRPVLTRDDVKKRFMADILAKQGNYPSVVEAVFREHFPTVHRFIRKVNRDGAEHANLIRLLQRAESDLVIGIVAADLSVRWPQMFMLTLHDSIFATGQDIPFVVEAFEAAFHRNGYSMSLKSE